MILAFLFLAIGFLLVFLEFFLPGLIFGIAGGLLIILSIVFFAIAVPSLWLLFLFIVGITLFLIFLVYFSLKRIKRGSSFYLHKNQEGYVASSFEKEYIGKKGKALSDLKPAGHILIEGKRLQAVSQSGYILKDTSIEVIGGEGAHLIVKTGK